MLEGHIKNLSDELNPVEFDFRAFWQEETVSTNDGAQANFGLWGRCSLPGGERMLST
jgi:hypothetical protein